MKKSDISNNPLSLLVAPRTVLIDTKKLKYRDVQQDEFFLKKYQDFLIGKLKGYITRVSIERIKPGFYKRVKDGWEHIVDDVPVDHIDYLTSIIRGGYRPALHLYHNLNKDCGFDFICADDVAIYYAYLSLGIRKPPVMLLGSKKNLEESALTIKGFPSVSKSFTHLIFSMETVNKTSLPSLLGESISKDIPKELLRLEEYVHTLKNDFRLFHSIGAADVSYHQIMFGMLTSASEMIKSIRVLVENGLIIQSSYVVRSLYELSLNFYLFWLSPHDITKLVQLSSLVSENQWGNECDKMLRESLSLKLDTQAAEKIKAANLYQFKITTSVIEKARLSPFGESYYKDVYSFLSDIAHHSLSVSARYRGSLELGDDAVYDSDVRNSILRVVDFCVTKILLRIEGDIGSEITLSEK
ncbi:DUF5677 domain-containing protein [Rheinheimera fenheensis]|uniref:DUF5677 domain-containing protein n=1 Tax=Rheinheimera fenheensis TaxID=3152295 RepID=UPI00325F6912